MSNQKTNGLVTIITGIVMMVVLLFGGATFGVRASQHSGYNDAHQQSKTNSEQTLSNLATLSTTDQTASASSDSPSSSPSLEIQGTVQAINSQELVVDGVHYVLNSSTEMKGAINVGDLVKLHVIVNNDGSQLVSEVELTTPTIEENDQNPSPDDEQNGQTITDNEDSEDNSDTSDVKNNEEDDTIEENDGQNHETNSADNHAGENGTHENDNENDPEQQDSQESSSMHISGHSLATITLFWLS